MTLSAIQGDLKKAMASGNSEEIGKAELDLMDKINKINKGEISPPDIIDRPINMNIVQQVQFKKSTQSFLDFKLSISDVRDICDKTFKVDDVSNYDYYSQIRLKFDNNKIENLPRELEFIVLVHYILHDDELEIKFKIPALYNHLYLNNPEYSSKCDHVISLFKEEIQKKISKVEIFKDKFSFTIEKL